MSKYHVEEKVAKLGRVGSVLSKAFYILIKRTFDIICGLIGVICLLPLAAVIKICNLLAGDKESIFYAQKRIGLDGKEFSIYKFRSMVPNAEEKLKEILEKDEALAEEYRVNKKLENDPRITKVGKFIRKTSLDETPQLLNVLKGDMALIGNRPYLPGEKEDMGEYYSDIIKTKPGITGYWQVSGRSDTTFEKRCQLEQYYSNHANLKMDVEIFFKTFGVVLGSKGAK
ncbi:MAG: sugar transferase [Clostridia bacterium]|nr:sugar transferase [Clostridia bacterium]